MQNVPKIVHERLRAETPAIDHPDADVLTAFAERCGIPMLGGEDAYSQDDDDDAELSAEEWIAPPAFMKNAARRSLAWVHQLGRGGTHRFDHVVNMNVRFALLAVAQDSQTIGLHAQAANKIEADSVGLTRTHHVAETKRAGA